MALPQTLIIFGASGDLTARKLIPSLYNLARKGRLPEELRIVGISRTPLSDAEFHQRVEPLARQTLREEFDPEIWQRFLQRVHYVPGDATQAAGLQQLQAWLAGVETNGKGDRLYYLSVAPELYGTIAAGLGEAGMAAQGPQGWRRLIIEKPFGKDLASAQELNASLQRHFREDQVYRIDHYLGKETVQNMLVFRFANTLFEPLWNNTYIDHVQITVSENVVVGSRGDYYDRSGVLRDMFQNHLLQILTIIAMEAPARFAPEPLRNEKVKVLDAIPIPSLEEAQERIVVGQYEGYRAEKGVAPDSVTPTYAAVELQVDNWRWRGVPFFLRSGKALASRVTEVVIQFRCPPHLMFPLPRGTTLECNRLSICIQPDEGIHLNFQSKVPDHGSLQLQPTDMEFHYRDAYPDRPLPEAYERLLQDALAGDASLFMRSDEIERAWTIIDPLIAASESLQPQVYPRGAAGPTASDQMLARSGRRWLSLCGH
ncbi:MAG: glucose-6-phosphate dehydrogenase [Gemmataceae bacterium]